MGPARLFSPSDRVLIDFSVSPRRGPKKRPPPRPKGDEGAAASRGRAARGDGKGGEDEPPEDRGDPADGRVILGDGALRRGSSRLLLFLLPLLLLRRLQLSPPLRRVHLELQRPRREMEV